MCAGRSLDQLVDEGKAENTAVPARAQPIPAHGRLASKRRSTTDGAQCATAGFGPNSVVAGKLQERYCLCPLPVSKSTSASKNARTAAESWENVARIAIAASMLTASSLGSIAASGGSSS